MSEGEAAGGEAGAGRGGEDAGQGDAVLLAPLTEETFLHNLHVRYKQDIIYTYVGNALVCVNPCRALPLYSAELVRSYLSRPPYQLPPHLYALTATAYRWVRDRNESQCIVITGESGSGKTEAARVCLQCAVVAGAGAGRGGGGGAGCGGALAAAGTLLEAFGNAATARNHNASRFGKLLDIEFDFKGDPIGGHITHYLLEKERVCRVLEGERNFHVFYQLLAGADNQLLKRLKLQRSWEQYRMLLGSGSGDTAGAGAGAGSPRRPLQADREHFQHTTAAMAALGLCAPRRAAVLRVLAFCLKLANLDFQPDANIDGSIGVRIHHEYELEEACSVVGVDAGRLRAALGVPPPPPDSSDSTVPEAESWEEGVAGWGEDAGDAEWARGARDRLLCALYNRLFLWLINQINDKIKPLGGGSRGSLGILDVYGLESLAHNGLERLLINYAAERVHAAVCAASLRREQEEYCREGLAWEPIEYGEHELTADLLDNGPESVLGVIRECVLRGETDAGLLPRLARRRHPRLRVLPPQHFQVVHYGGAVTYSARGVVAAARDAVPAGAGALAAAREPLLRALFPAGSPRRAAPAPLGCRQRALVAALVRRLPAAPRLVRCLRAAPALRPRRFHAPTVARQIHDQGIMEMALLRRAGWCEATCARALLARYGVLRPLPAGPARPAAAGAEEPVRAARALLRSLPIPSAEFAYGRTKVFIRSPRTVWELEALRLARVEQLVSRAQACWRRHRDRARQLARHRAARIIAAAYRNYRATRDLPERQALRRQLQTRRVVAALPWAGRVVWARGVLWRGWARAARRRYLRGLWARLPPRQLSPACAAWPPPPAPLLLGVTDRLLRRLHHRWRCHRYRLAFDQTARNRMREKVTASVLFKERKVSYPASVSHPFVGDYVRLRASAAWRRGPGARLADRCVVFADVVGKVSRASGRVSRALVALTTGALLVLDAASLRLKRRVAAAAVYRLSLSPLHDDVLCVHAAADAEDEAAPCLWPADGAARRGDLLLRTCHVLELATKLFLVVQNATAHAPHVNIATMFEANFGQQIVTVTFHAAGEGGARLLRRGSRMDVIL